MYKIVFAICVLGAVYFIWTKVFRSTPSSNKTNSLVTHRAKRLGREVADTNDPVKSKLNLSAPAVEQIKIKQTGPIPEEFSHFALIDKPSTVNDTEFHSKVSELNQPNPILRDLCEQIVEPKQLYSIIKKDPELVVKVLNFANSAIFDITQPITNINHAVAFLGITQVKSIARQFVLSDKVHLRNKAQQQAHKRIWAASYIANSLAIELCKELNIDDGGELATLCQLSYLGDFAILVAHNDAAEWYLGNTHTLARTQQSQSLFGMHQGHIASLLAQQWQLPDTIIAALASSLSPLQSSFDASTTEGLGGTKMLVCYISCRLADILVYNQAQDILDCDRLGWQSTGRPEFCFTHGQIKQAKIDNIHDVFSRPAFKNKALRLFCEINQ